jgi:hypothetical protein
MALYIYFVSFYSAKINCWSIITPWLHLMFAVAITIMAPIASMVIIAGKL